MYEQVEKTPEQKSQSVANTISQRQSSHAPTSRHEDKRPEAIQMRKIRDLAKNSPQNAKLRKLHNLAAIQKKHNVKQGFGFVDTRLETTTLKQLSLIADTPITEESVQLNKKKSSNTIVKQRVLSEVIQGVWLTVDGDSKKTQFQNNGNGTYTNSDTGKVFKLKPGDSTTVILVSSPSAGLSHQPMPELGTWTEASTGLRPATPYGFVSATHKRGAPYLGSRAGDYGGFQMGDTYKEFIKALRSGGKTDAVIATAILNRDATAFTSVSELRGAAMFHATVNLAEEWRKHGASKLCRGELRLIKDGKATFDTFLYNFAFVESADAGRKQVARMHETQYGYTDEDDLSGHDAELYGALSQPQKGDLSSDDEERNRKEGAVKKRRVFTRVS